MPKTPGLSDLSPERCNAEPAGSRLSGAGAEWPRCLGVLPSSRHPCRHVDTVPPQFPEMTTRQILTSASPPLAIEYQIVVAIHVWRQVPAN